MDAITSDDTAVSYEILEKYMKTKNNKKKKSNKNNNSVLISKESEHAPTILVYKECEKNLNQ